MANENAIGKVTSAAVTQWQACEIASGEVNAAAAVTDNIFGVAQFGAASGERVTLITRGRTKCLVDGSGTAIAAGDELSPSATAGVLVSHAGTSTHTYAGRALEAATGSSDVIWIELYGSNREA